MITRIDRIRGCLFGLAIGDALGYPVEFKRGKEITKQQPLTLHPRFLSGYMTPVALYSDDTQMAIATADACLFAANNTNPQYLTDALRHAYHSWRITQVTNPQARRAPGNSCMTALTSGTPVYSKGCGGVMRTAPVGLFRPDTAWAFASGCDAAMITHSHPTGYYPAGMIAAVISGLMTGVAFDVAYGAAMNLSPLTHDTLPTRHALNQACSQEAADMPLSTLIADIGEGWVAEEALAIAVVCVLRVLRTEATPEAAYCAGIRAAAAHDGDSDSTACIAGAILGTLYGVQAIPQAWRGVIENADGLESLAGRIDAVTQHA